MKPSTKKRHRTSKKARQPRSDFEVGSFLASDLVQLRKWIAAFESDFRDIVQEAHPRWCFTYQGKPMRAVGSAWERSLRRAGIEAFRFHDPRHTWASWHVMSGTSLQGLMELGGWKSYETVLRYAHLAPEHLSSAAKRIERVWDVVDGGSTISLR